MNCKLSEIFLAQRTLMEKFHAIEAGNGFRIESSVPVNLDDPHDQLRLKELAWRVTEEVGESALALGYSGIDSEEYYQELSDVTHFLVELMIVAGITPSMLIPMPSEKTCRLEQSFLVVYETPVSMEDAFLDFVVLLTQAMNQLRNRPWKQSRVSVNRASFIHFMREAWNTFVIICIESGMSANQFHDQYFKKNRVNQDRQSSGV